MGQSTPLATEVPRLQAPELERSTEASVNLGGLERATRNCVGGRSLLQGQQWDVAGGPEQTFAGNNGYSVTARVRVLRQSSAAPREPTPSHRVTQRAAQP